MPPCTSSAVLVGCSFWPLRSVVRRCASSTRRALDVAVVGAPNVGKSLLTNQIIKAAVCAVSSRMDTTTRNTVTVLTEGDVQLHVVDSPGMVGLAHAREVIGRSKGDRILTDPEEAVRRAAHILVVQDSTAVGDYIHHRVMHLLHRYSHIPSSLVLNKVDLVSDRADLLELTRILTKGQVAGAPIKTAKTTIGRLGKADNEIRLHDTIRVHDDEKWKADYNKIIARPVHQVSFSETKRVFMSERGWSNFSAVFFCSALTGEGIEPLREHLQQLATLGDWRSGESEVARKSPQAICEESIRAALLDTVPANVAYKLNPRVTEWTENGEVLQIVAEISCEKERWGRLVVGRGGSRICEIGKRVNDQMSTLLQTQLFVRLLVKHNNKIVVAA